MRLNGSLRQHLHNPFLCNINSLASFPISYFSYFIPLTFYLAAQWDLQGTVLNRAGARQEIGYCPTFRSQLFKLIQLTMTLGYSFISVSTIGAREGCLKTCDICTAGSEVLLVDHDVREGFSLDKGCNKQRRMFLNHLSWCNPSLHSLPTDCSL